MSGASIEQYRRQLEGQVRSHRIKEEVERLRKLHPIFEHYSAIENLIDLGRPGGRCYEEKDAVLAVLLSEIKRAPTIFALLNLMFWDSLLRLFYSKRKNLPAWDHDELFARIQVDFFHTAVSYPLERRPRKIDVNLVLDTKKRVTRWQREEALYRERHEEFGPAHEDKQALSELVVSRVFPEEMEAWLLDLVYRKVINEQQYDLLLETEVHKRMTEKAWAESRGVPYATVRSWHHRAKMAIQKHVKAGGEPA